MANSEMEAANPEIGDAEIETSGYVNMMHPPIEDLVDKTGSKFLLVTLSAQRANDINTYYQGLGSGMAGVAPPQVGGYFNNYLSVAFEEIGEDKTILNRDAPAPIVSPDILEAPEEG